MAHGSALTVEFAVLTTLFVNAAEGTPSLPPSCALLRHRVLEHWRLLRMLRAWNPQTLLASLQCLGQLHGQCRVVAAT